MSEPAILITDDDPRHLELLRHKLALAFGSRSVVTAADEAGCLAAARARPHDEPFDCVVVDFNLNDRTALQTLDRLRSISPDTPAVVISGSTAQRVVIDALRSGAADFVNKRAALRGDALERSVRRVIRESRERRRDRRVRDRHIAHLKQAAETDRLTGLLNRHAVERFLGTLGADGERRSTIGVLLADIDHFKRINDTLGHDAGDRALQRIARVMSSVARPSDACVRWGGEEFMLLMPSAHESLAWAAAERFRCAVERSHTGPDADGPPLTVSIGVAVITNRDPAQSPADRADDALYLAKSLGRNRTCTERMSEALRVAESLHDDRDLPPNDDGALERLRDALLPNLGPIQRDHLTTHGTEVRDNSAALADGLRLAPCTPSDILTAAEFHDIGKAVVPEQLLALPRRLEPAERALVNTHAAFGGLLAQRAGVDGTVARLIASHHARFDDPPAADGVGESRPGDVGSYILAVADAVAAMRSDRPYHPPLSPPEIARELQRGSGTQFHPHIAAKAGIRVRTQRLAA